MQRQLAATEAEFRCALQEGAQECADLRRDLETLAADGVEMRRALQEEHQKRKVRGLGPVLPRQMYEGGGE